tara:strand:- start:19 stop:198 length:180 start_codon:yes stop_codon:yes gene_type:complete
MTEDKNFNMLDILVCPITHIRLKFNSETNELISTAANLAFPLKNKVPIMLADEARTLSE